MATIFNTRTKGRFLFCREKKLAISKIEKCSVRTTFNSTPNNNWVHCWKVFSKLSSKNLSSNGTVVLRQTQRCILRPSKQNLLSQGHSRTEIVTIHVYISVSMLPYYLCVCVCLWFLSEYVFLFLGVFVCVCVCATEQWCTDGEQWNEENHLQTKSKMKQNQWEAKCQE